MRWLTAWVIALSLACAAQAAESEWSPEVEGLRGRLLADVSSKTVRLTLELQNIKSLPRWISTHDPFAFDLVVKDAAGKELAPDAERVDITSSPQAAILARECYAGIPVTLKPGAEERWNLDTTTKLWKLKPGKYTLIGVYRVADRGRSRGDGYPRMSGKAYEWSGEIACPEIEIKVPEK